MRIRPIRGVLIGKSLGTTGARRHLHGLRRQPAIRLDAVRQSHRRQVPLGTRRHPGGIHDFRADRDLAGSGRRLSGRPLRAALGRDRRRDTGRHRLGHQFDRRLAAGAVFRRRDRRHRHRLRLRHLRRQRAQVVSRAGAVWRPASPPRASAPARRSRSCRSRT